MSFALKRCQIRLLAILLLTIQAQTASAFAADPSINQPYTEIPYACDPNNGYAIVKLIWNKPKTSFTLQQTDPLTEIGALPNQIKKIKGKIKKLKDSPNTTTTKKKRAKLKALLKTLKASVSLLPNVATYCDNLKNSGNFATVQAIIQNRCMGCHASTWQNNESSFLATGRVVPANLSASTLYTYLNGNPDGFTPGYMPKGLPAIPASEIGAIRSWILSLSPQNGAVNFSCTPGSDPSPTVFKRLSKLEFTNTIRDLLSVLNTSDASSVMTSIQTSLVFLPDDEVEHNFDRQDNRVTQDHVNALFRVANDFANGVTVNTTRQAAISQSSNCASALSTSTTCSLSSTATSCRCISDFLNNFGLRTFRRPLTSGEKTDYITLYNVNKGVQGLRDITMRLLMSPNFTYLVEVNGTPVNGRNDLLEIDDYELASRLSYHFWQTMPDQVLLTAAGNGTLKSNLPVFVSQLLYDPSPQRTRSTLQDFFSEWLHLDSIPYLNQSNSPAFNAFASGLNVNQPGHNHRTDMIQEVQDLTNYYTWDVFGTYNDLLLSDISFATTPDLAQIYGVPTWQVGTPFVRFGAGERGGILNRSAMLASGVETTSPIQRGVFIRREMLCDPLPDPPVEIMDQVVPPPFNPAVTMRDRVTTLTSPSQCAVCHQHNINPLGFSLEPFDALGRKRSTEKIYNSNGTLANELPINPVVAPEVTIGESTEIGNPTQMSEFIVNSGKGQACFVRKYFRFAYRRFEDDAQDGCALLNLHGYLTASPGGSLRSMFSNVALQAEFKLRKIKP